jgi:predicted phosphodiesterase
MVKMVNWLVTSDIHLSDRPRDQYRLGLFRWLAEQQKRYNVTATFILGDLTEKKDNHSATLVNRAIDEMTRLKPPVYILRGNHDGLDPNNPFFRFLNCIDGFNFITNPNFDISLSVALIPHCRSQQEFDDALKVLQSHKATVMCHQTFDGAIAETGVRLNGLSTATLAATKPLLVLAGDVHRPQHQGIVHYVGAPYHVRFGDDFEPRVLLITGTNVPLGLEALKFPAPRKWVVKTNEAWKLPEAVRKGDHVKIVLTLEREDAVNWHHHRRAMLGLCRDKAVEVFGIDLHIKGEFWKFYEGGVPIKQQQTPEQVLTAFCNHEGITDALRNAGLGLLKNHEHRCE